MNKYCLILLSAAISSQALAQLNSAVAPASQPVLSESKANEDVPLGELFASRIAGIQFRPPAGGTLVRQINSGDVVRFIYGERNWDLRCKMVHLAEPVPMTAPPTNAGDGGLLEMTAAELKASNASANVLFQSVTDMAPYKDGEKTGPVGLIEARYNAGSQRVTTREAIFRLDDQAYYVFQLTSPGKPKGEPQFEADQSPEEAQATKAFQKMLGTVKLLDRGELKKEQVNRLFATRNLFATWSEARMKAAVQPEQFFRVVRDGKDVGYLQERDVLIDKPDDMAAHGNHTGIEVQLRSYVVGEDESKSAAPPAPPETGAMVVPTPVIPAEPAALPAPTGPTKLDRLAKMFVSFDRRHEDWTVTTVIDSGLGPVQTSEIGISDIETHKAFDVSAAKKGETGDEAGKDRKEPPVRQVEQHHLSVSNYAKIRTGVPIERDLPVYYIPMAVTHLLPRLVSLDEPGQYMFASYVSDQKEVMARYVDVQREQEVVLDGKKIRAVPVVDRIGVEGSATIHYMTHEGEWLGSVNVDQKVMVLPSDKESIKQLWKDADLGDAVEKTDNKDPKTVR